jgi:predicted RNA-binding protein with TRAM domain
MRDQVFTPIQKGGKIMVSILNVARNGSGNQENEVFCTPPHSHILGP